MSAQPIKNYGPAPTSNGVLDCFVQQPVPNSPSEDMNGVISYTEKWKGPYSRGKGVLASVSTGDAISKLDIFLGSNRISRIPRPTAYYRKYNDDGSVATKIGVWRIRAINVEELTAGDHCIIQVDCETVPEETTVTTLTEDEFADTWSISWQSYSVTPYEFASGIVHGGTPLSPSGQGWTPDWSLPASRTMIERYKSSNPTTTYLAGQTVYVFTPNPKTPDHRLTLSPAEGELMKKIASNRCATYHYPILTHQTACTGNDIKLQFDKDLGGELDVATGLPAECPYKFAKVKGDGGEMDWIWLKIGDDMTQTKSKLGVRYERREMWAGYTDVDKNYYGSQPFSHDEKGIKNGRWYKNCL